MAKKSVVKGGIIGVVLGAIGGILFAPKSGKETRQDIKDAALKANKEAEAKLKKLHTELGDKADEAKKMAEEYKGKAKTELNELGQRAEFAKQKVSELISAVREFEAEESEVEKILKEGKKVVADITGKGKDSKAKSTTKKK